MNRYPVSRVELPDNCPVCYVRHDPAVHGERAQCDGEVLTVDEWRLRGVVS